MDTNHSNFRKLTKYIWPFGFSLLLWGILEIFTDFVSNTNANYILSSITQGLASLVALLFVIIFFLCQSTGKVSMLSRVLKPEGYFLLGIFVITIILPLVTIKIGYTIFLVDLSISMCAFCLFSIIPFIIAVNEITKKFGVRDIITNLGVMEFPRDDLKYGELFDDLEEISLKDIIKLEPDFIISSLIEVLNKSINSPTNFSNKSYSMGMLADLGVLSLIEEGSEGYFNDIKQIIGKKLLQESFTIGSKENFIVSLSGISKVLSKLKLHGKCNEEIRLYFAEMHVRALNEIFNNLKDKEEGKLVISKSEESRITLDMKVSQEKLEKQIRSFLKKELIYLKDYKKVYEECLTLNKIQDEGKEEFEKYLANLLNSNE